ncbi:trypsin-like serine peptidase [Mesorhizobium neociceri]|uniref:Trypsin-like peptidase domain-containing protein n=1 Tax=Mesorhizobium neociceri TaxID=1307853 RepID=A0A838B6V1_9HYPH|nr:serine protease [Mesorhizobium neociceri]MBA1141812.1 trypsin-like peptidase domain-containing protein [Mesorhizobium neociceri]
MAIILGQQYALESIVLADARPALLVKDDWIVGAASERWQPVFVEHKATIERAIRATCRLETSDGTLPFLGTAFGVAPRLAVTGKQLARLLKTDGKKEYWLNFKAEYESDAMEKIPVTGVRFVHPDFDFAVLELERDLAPEQILTLSPDVPEKGQDICVIGYPAFDLRNDREIQEKLFQSIYNVKRVMPGKITGFEEIMSFGKNALSLMHDATTLGGTAGAPVIDLASGDVVGINFAGRYLVANYAVPAWRLSAESKMWTQTGLTTSATLPPPPAISAENVFARWGRALTQALAEKFPVTAKALQSPLDLKDEEIAKKIEEISRNIIGGSLKIELVNIFTQDDIISLHDNLINVARFTTDSDLASLFEGLPLDLQASWPDRDSTSAKLLARLRRLNRIGALIAVENHTPFFVVLRSAKYLRKTEPLTVTMIDGYLATVIAAEAKASAANGIH